MNAKPVPCPGCGKPVAGKFCSHCGTAIASTCPSCGAKVKPGARACPECGASLAARMESEQGNARAIVPWAALVLAAVALVVAVVALFDRGDGATATARFSPPMSSNVPAPGQPLDLAGMSPREAADRLFNRIMAASENGDSEEARRFAPMALQAYASLGTLDNDARYHVALIHLTASDIKSARLQLDQLRQSVPKHLLGSMLEHQIAEHSGNKDGAARSYKSFLAAYDAEIATGKAEYLEHRSGIERFRAAAQASKAGKK
jgi:hypothetical protein